MKKTAIITGIHGQDGAYLAQLLLEKNYRVIGADRRRADSIPWRLKDLGIHDDVEYIYMDLLEYSNMFETIKRIKPTEIYNLAAQSFVSASFKMPVLTSEINAMGTLKLLDIIKTLDSNIKFYQASTSEMFGKIHEPIQSETTPLYPRSPYAVSKLFAHWMVKNYRESYNIFATSGILFNHESPYRGIDFVTKKITDHIARHSLQPGKELLLGNLSACRDWGYAKEYVKGMYLMMQHHTPSDFVLATGKTFSIKEFVVKAFKYVDIDIEWEGEGVNERGYDAATNKLLVRVSEEFYRPAEVELLKGDYSKAKAELGWEPKTSIDELIKIMIDFDIKMNKTIIT